ncbi:MAG: hypothetical protein H0Z32_03825 [Bacillaceae bacterium]|nr:hypothetical protein [Bacillaceae bacterium]
MNAHKKAFFFVLVVLTFIIAIIVWLTYSHLKGDASREEEVFEAAEIYVKEHFDEPMKVVGTLYDNADLFNAFQYAAKVEPEHDAKFQFLVFYHSESETYQDSYVAEIWEEQLEEDLQPYLTDHFGDINSLWIYYPKDIGYQLDIPLDDIPRYNGQKGYPVIQISLTRKKEKGDSEKVDALVDYLQTDLGVEHGTITLDFPSGLIKSRGILKEF